MKIINANIVIFKDEQEFVNYINERVMYENDIYVIEQKTGTWKVVKNRFATL